MTGCGTLLLGMKAPDAIIWSQPARSSGTISNLDRQLGAGADVAVSHLQLRLTPAPASRSDAPVRVCAHVERVTGKRVHVPALLSGRLKARWEGAAALHVGEMRPDGTWPGVCSEPGNLRRKVNMAAHEWPCRLLPSLTCADLLLCCASCVAPAAILSHTRIVAISGGPHVVTRRCSTRSGVQHACVLCVPDSELDGRSMGADIVRWTSSLQARAALMIATTARSASMATAPCGQAFRPERSSPRARSVLRRPQTKSRHCARCSRHARARGGKCWLSCLASLVTVRCGSPPVLNWHQVSALRAHWPCDNRDRLPCMCVRAVIVCTNARGAMQLDADGEPGEGSAAAHMRKQRERPQPSSNLASWLQRAAKEQDVAQVEERKQVSRPALKPMDPANLAGALSRPHRRPVTLVHQHCSV